MMRRITAPLGAIAILASLPAATNAQPMQGMDMKGMAMPAPMRPVAKKAVAKGNAKKPTAQARERPRLRPAATVRPLRLTPGSGATTSLSPSRN